MHFSFSSPLPPAPLSRTEVIHIGKPSHQSLTWVSLGPYSVFLVSVRRIRVIRHPQLVDDAIAGNSSRVMDCTDISDFTFKTACYTSKPDRSHISISIFDAEFSYILIHFPLSFSSVSEVY